MEPNIYFLFKILDETTKKVYKVVLITTPSKRPENIFDKNLNSEQKCKFLNLIEDYFYNNFDLDKKNLNLLSIEQVDSVHYMVNF